MTYQLGIDLGTTYTCAAVCRSSDRRVEPEVVTLGSQGASVPSVLFLAEDGGVVVGEAAERRAVTDFDRVVREFKRRIGDPTPVMVAGRPWAPQELSARLVRWVVDRVAEREGGPAERIAVTHPAAWGAHKKELLASALAGQGLTVTFLAEPQAAALSYATNERVGGGSTIVVYDLGGGTFDAAVVRKDDGAGGAAGFSLLGRPEGLERLGGVDFDEVVYEHVLDGMPDAFAELDDSDPAVLSAVARLRRDCTEAKEALSSDTEVAIPVMLPSARGSVRLHRSEFEAMIRPQVEETVSALRNAVLSAGLSPEQLTAVLLVGGSSRIPLVGQLVSEQLGRPVAVDADPKNAIAKGAALSIAPRPTSSWPGASAPPVPNGMPGAPPGARPGPPPARPPMGAPPAAGGRHAGIPVSPYAEGPGAPYAEPATPQRGMQPAAAAYAPAGGRHGRSHTAELAPTHPARPAVDAEPDWDYEPERPRERRPNGMTIGIGAVAAVAVVVLAFIFWPTGSDTPVDAGNEGGAPTSESAPAESGGGGSGGGSSGRGGAAPAPAEPAPDDSATSAPAPTSADEEPTKEDSSSTPSDEPSEDSGSDTTEDSGTESGGSGGSDSGSDSSGDSGGAGESDSGGSSDNALGAVGESPVSGVTAA
jgi:molecular chaperone DnaK